MDNLLDKLTPKQIKFIDYLMLEPSFEQACKKAHIAKKTGIEWRNKPNFQKAYREAKTALFKQTNKNLLTQIDSAINTLVEIKDNKENSAAARVTASKAIIDYAFKGYETTELVSRMDELEGRLNNEY